MSDAPLYSFRRKGRSWSTLTALVLAWLALIVIATAFDAALVLVVVLFLLTLPAVWDLYSGRDAGADLTQTELSWFSGPHAITVPLTEIDHVRLVTRLDLTVRAAVVLPGGRKLRVPAEATPPHEPLKEALDAVGIRSERHHFTFL